MPDLTEETFWLCASAHAWETTINGHVVRYGYQARGPVQYDYACDCKGFTYRRRCRHIDEAKTAHCKWHQFIDGGEPTVEHHCPRCGGPVTAERWAV